MDYSEAEEIRKLILAKVGGDSNHTLKEAVEQLCDEVTRLRAVSQVTMYPRTGRTPSGYARNDQVKCLYCGIEQVVEKGSTVCLNCRRRGNLAWMNENQPEVDQDPGMFKAE